MARKHSRRIGIYAGTFDPVHTGHITFALQSVEAARLDKVYFLPERRPRYKQAPTHFGHRAAMLKHAARPYKQFEVLDHLADTNFTVKRTLPELRRIFEGDELVFLFGSDVLTNLPQWSGADQLLTTAELVIGLRKGDDHDRLRHEIETWPTPPKSLTMFVSYAPDVSSGGVREALRNHRTTPGLLSSIERYSNRHWLYVSLDKPKR